MISAELTSAALMLTGDGEAPAAVSAVGARARVEGTVTVSEHGWAAEVPLLAARFGGPLLPLPTGEYELRLTGREADVATIDLALLVMSSLRAQVTAGSLIIGPPIDPAYDSAEAQDALERRYATPSGELEEAVFYESFYGRNASCNPLAIDRELAARLPGLTRYWSVIDLSVPVPDGAIPIIEGSPEWWRARGAARLLVVNDWLRRRYVRRPGQRVLQTWHGTPLKRLALHRPGFDPRRMAAVVKESLRWDGLLAQNTYAERILRKAYAFLRRPIWVEGYPRNDVLVTGDGSAVRASLGIAANERVLLFAPTWRDDRSQIVDHLDPAALAAEADAVVLVRGHSRTLLPGRDATGPRVIDVTGYPDTAQLLLASDALITDYSSVMFDYSVTSKPMYFLVPDVDHYRGTLRGFYFDLAERAPGPVVHSQRELVEALMDPTVDERYATKYAAWRAQFNRRDDGRSGERVANRLIDQRWIGTA